MENHQIYWNHLLLLLFLFLPLLLQLLLLRLCPDLNVLAAVWSHISRILCYCKHQITDSKTLTHTYAASRIHWDTFRRIQDTAHTHKHKRKRKHKHGRGAGLKCVWANVLFGHAGGSPAHHSNHSIRQSPVTGFRRAVSCVQFSKKFSPKLTSGVSQKGEREKVCENMSIFKYNQRELSRMQDSLE